MAETRPSRQVSRETVTKSSDCGFGLRIEKKSLSSRFSFWFPVSRFRYRVILVVAMALMIAVFLDWTRSPRDQFSVVLYQKVVLVGYRTVLKPFSDRFIRCRFEPSCSAYSEEAMLTYGFPEGLKLTVERLFRCMPWVPAGTKDPVPPFRGNPKDQAPNPK